LVVVVGNFKKQTGNPLLIGFGSFDIFFVVVETNRMLSGF
jgi:hypothetical protein